MSDMLYSMDTKDMTAISFRLPLDLYDRIRVAAAKERKSAQQWMREALDIVVTHEEQKDAKQSL